MYRGDTTGVMICIVSDLMTETMYTDTERKKTERYIGLVSGCKTK